MQPWTVVMAQSKEQAEQAAKKQSPLILILMMVVLMGASVGGTLFFVGAFSGGDGDGQAHGEQEQAHHPEVKEAHYFAFKEPFTVNFETETGLRFLQVQLQVMSRDEASLKDLETHMPVIRNNIIFLLSSQPFLTLVDREGKEQVRKAILEDIQKVLQERTGHAGIEELYFTAFVIQ